MPSFLQGSEPNQVYLTWMRGVGYGDSKYAIVSSDAGVTWSDPQLIVPEKRGMNGPMSIAVDSLGTKYLALSGDQTEIGTRIWISRNTGKNSWSDPIPISGTELHESEFPQAIVRNGNELHVFWLDWGQQEVISVTCSLDAPMIPPIPFVSDTFTQEAPALTQSPTPVETHDPIIQPSAESSRPNSGAFDTQAVQADSDASILGISVLAPSLLVVAVVMWQLVRRGHKR